MVSGYYSLQMCLYMIRAWPIVLWMDLKKLEGGGVFFLDLVVGKACQRRRYLSLALNKVRDPAMGVSGRRELRQREDGIYTIGA